MLQFMRKHAKFFYIFFFIIIISFIFLYVGPPKINHNPVLAEVGGSKIYLREYWERYERLKEFYRNIYQNEDKIEEKLDLKNRVLDMLIQERLLLKQAKDLGLTVTDKELQEAIMNEPIFLKDGVFRKEVYLKILQLNRITPTDYERMKRKELLLRKMRALIEDAVDLTWLDLDKFKENNNKEFQKVIRNIVLSEKKEKVVRAYIEGIKKKVHVKINSELI